MKPIQYLLLVLVLSFFSACNATKEPKKEENKESDTTLSHLGELTVNQKVIKEEVDKYLKELNTFNTDAIVDMTYPRLFHVIDLDLFRQYIASMMNSTDIEMQSYDTNISKISKMTAFSNDTRFAQVEYISKVKIHFLNNYLYDTEEKINFLYDALIHKHGAENITIKPEERILIIQKKEKLLMIKEKDTTWKFLGDNVKYRQLYPSFLPPEILKII